MWSMANVDLAEVDPVSGMKVLPQETTASVEHAGRTWYFCCAGCRTKFEAAPSPVRRLTAGWC